MNEPIYKKSENVTCKKHFAGRKTFCRFYKDIQGYEVGFEVRDRIKGRGMAKVKDRGKNRNRVKHEK